MRFVKISNENERTIDPIELTTAGVLCAAKCLLSDGVYDNIEATLIGNVIPQIFCRELSEAMGSTLCSRGFNPMDRLDEAIAHGIKLGDTFHVEVATRDESGDLLDNVTTKLIMDINDHNVTSSNMLIECLYVWGFSSIENGILCSCSILELATMPGYTPIDKYFHIESL